MVSLSGEPELNAIALRAGFKDAKEARSLLQRVDLFLVDLAAEITRFRAASARARAHGRRYSGKLNADALSTKYGLSPEGHGWLDVVAGTVLLQSVFADPYTSAKAVVDARLAVLSPEDRAELLSAPSCITQEAQEFEALWSSGGLEESARVQGR